MLKKIAKVIVTLVDKILAEELVTQKKFHFDVSKRKCLWISGWSCRQLALLCTVQQLLHCTSEASAIKSVMGQVFKSVPSLSSQSVWLRSEPHPSDSYYRRCCPQTVLWARTLKSLRVNGYQNCLHMDSACGPLPSNQHRIMVPKCSEHKSQDPHKT